MWNGDCVRICGYKKTVPTRTKTEYMYIENWTGVRRAPVSRARIPKAPVILLMRWRKVIISAPVRRVILWRKVWGLLVAVRMFERGMGDDGPVDAVSRRCGLVPWWRWVLRELWWVCR